MSDTAAKQEAAEAKAREAERPAAAKPGDEWLFDESDELAAVWGHGTDVLWSRGEPCMLFAPQGVGKTTLAQNLANARMGITDKVLGHPIEPGESKVLYLALDRPMQARRSWKRMLTVEEHREITRERLVIRDRPLMFSVLTEPEKLATMASYHGADTLVIDSLKNIAVGLSNDDVGAAIDMAFQHVVSLGVQLLVCHHPRKMQQDVARKPRELDDVYGSTWITTGCGSVLSLWGTAGDAIVNVTQLKEPMQKMAPVDVHHDQRNGTLTVLDKVDAWTLLDGAPTGLTAPTWPCRSTGRPSPIATSSPRPGADSRISSNAATPPSSREAPAAPVGASRTGTSRPCKRDCSRDRSMHGSTRGARAVPLVPSTTRDHARHDVFVPESTRDRAQSCAPQSTRAAAPL